MMNTLSYEVSTQRGQGHYDIFGSLAFAPLGLLLAGPIAAVIGPRAALLGCAGLVTAATLAALLSPAVRKLNAPILVSGA